MLNKSNKRIVREFYEQVVSTGDVSHIADYIHPDCVEVDGDRRVTSGIAGMIAHVHGVRTTYSSLRIQVRRQVTEGDLVATEIMASGKHVGEWLGMAPTGRLLEFTGVNIDRVADGRIIEHGGAANLLLPLLEAGAVRVVGNTEPQPSTRRPE